MPKGGGAGTNHGAAQVPSSKAPSTNRFEALTPSGSEKSPHKNVTSPYLLSSSDIPGLVLVSYQLTK